MTDGKRQALAWAHGVTSAEALGGMLGPTVFVLPDGRQVSPLHVAPWADEPVAAGQPGILRRLRGEWPCVPFGSDGDRPAGNGWPASHTTPTVDPGPHGFSSNNDWTFAPAADGELALSIAYPEDHPIEGLTRRITPDPNSAAIDFELGITVRRDCELPFGLHPVVRVPRQPGAMRIEIEGKLAAATYPGDTDPTSIFAPGQITENWRAVKLRDGSTFDPSRVPFARHTEELLQVLKAPGQVSLWNTLEGYRLRLSWDPAHFPTVMFWFSNRGRQLPPWSGRHQAMGVEPICGALDLGPQISAQPNPISARGVPTTRHFTAGERFVTRYRLAVESAPAD